VLVRGWAGILVPDHDANGCAQSLTLEHPAQKLSLIGFVALGDQATLARPAAIEIELDLIDRYVQPWRAPIDDDANSATMALAIGVDPKRRAPGAAHPTEDRARRPEPSGEFHADAIAGLRSKNLTLMGVEAWRVVGGVHPCTTIGTPKGETMTFNLASAWESISDAIPDADALICGDTRLSWSEMEHRASRLAGGLASLKLQPRDNVGLCLYNGTEYLETQFGVMKQRCSPFNINYRYGAGELRSLLADADARVVFYSAGLVDRFEQIHRDLPDIVQFIQVGAEDNVPDWAVGYEAVIAANQPAIRLVRETDDLWLLFTGGTTGNPKGVMWPHETMVGTMAGNYSAMRMTPPASVDEAVAAVLEIADRGYVTRQLAAAPLMHGTSGITALATLTQGGAVLTMPGESFDADELWSCVQEHGATHLAIVGDAFCRPMLEALDNAIERGAPYDLSSIFLIMSSGVMWSAPIKTALLRHNPKMKLLDSLGSSEGAGFARKLEGDADDTSTARFELGENTRVLTEDGRDVVPGSGERGRLALSGHLPLGYYNDPIKSAETFPVIDGRRYSIPGDWATVEGDGSIVLLGRGSVCINTGGEKVYPEEVEEALKLIDGVVDTNVVGVPDERWGQAITAVVEFAPGVDIADASLVAGVREHLAAYKSPKHVVRVPAVVRGPNGKSDYRWALATALAGLGLPTD
jgi:acyl-CoA synthetase (AMP-forming)/AMP-acid ligase II